jgi:CRP-like cAMP-binding protein
MTIEDDIAVLEGVPSLRQLGAPALRILAIGAETRECSPGQVLFSAGEAADSAYIVQRGSFTLKSERAGDSEIVAGPGTLLGETALVTETQRPATATAREDSAVMRISRAMFLKMLEGYPEAAHRMRQVLAARADQWAREMDDVRTSLNPGTKPL